MLSRHLQLSQHRWPIPHLQVTRHRLSDLPGLLHQSPLLRLLPVTCLTALPSRQRRLDPLRVTFPKDSTLNRSKKR